MGLGPAGEVGPRQLRRAAGNAARATPRDGRLAVVVPQSPVDAPHAARAVAEGAGLGAYAFTRYKTKAPEAVALDAIVVVGDASGEAAVRRARIVVDAIGAARDLVNLGPSDKRPPALAEAYRDLVAGDRVTVEVLDEHALADGGFGGILGVGKGSSAPPRLVVMRYQPEGATRSVALIGKGITFDSGGLSLKPPAAMETMKCDMAGSAAVAAAVSALADLEVPVAVSGYAAIAENLPSGVAQRPGDVIRHRGGTTVEVLNTDAEGRLVLADALAYAVESEPDALVDLATLTGAQMVALGRSIAGIMGTDDGLVDSLIGAGERAGEQLWRLPLPDQYRDQLKSDVADWKNIGNGGDAGSIVAALLLKEFTAGRPWAHLDIAGPAFTEDGDDATLSKGGTGFGVATLLEWLSAGAPAS